MHFLHLEDSPSDFELIQEQLRSRWPNCTVTRVAARKDYEVAVLGGDFVGCADGFGVAERIFCTSSPRNAAVPTRCTSRPGLMDTNVAPGSESRCTEPN